MTPEETFTRDFHKRLFHNSRSRDPRRRIIRHAPLPPARPPSASIGIERRKQERRKERGERREERGERRKKKEERQKKNKKTHKKPQKTHKTTKNTPVVFKRGWTSSLYSPRCASTPSRRGLPACQLRRAAAARAGEGRGRRPRRPRRGGAAGAAPRCASSAESCET